MHVLLIALAAGYGVIAGLLVGRPLFRLTVQPDEPWRAACPGGHPLTGPAAGWLGLARCAPCGHGGHDGPSGGWRTGLGAYGPSVPLVAGVCALVCAGLAAAVGARPELVVWLLLVPLCVLLAGVDLAVHRLPDVLTLPMAGGSVALLGGAALLPGTAGSWSRAVFGGLALGGAYFVLFLINPNGMGFGDVKLALTAGVALGWYGWDVLFLGAFTGLLLGAFYGVALVLTRRAGRKAAMAFGPFMIIGAGAGILLGGLAAG
ncbi:prepilin peptidase [Streptomyces zagrosensis]|uniref:Leader peptidase (Prepilin peptidase)/N-methyltransferase n=1 Tax=Streptomyces zagrosensis TaxID=1042984 RepID=A0A7W9V1F6_9ACTN|nr:A24 family peptidase [Streptomyces zagrosensis]MBB5938191.1 leader peptidase (prepilin peptidase)/N-methyltransferase [Streptomyces zagrosensis]